MRIARAFVPLRHSSKNLIEAAVCRSDQQGAIHAAIDFMSVNFIIRGALYPGGVAASRLFQEEGRVYLLYAVKGEGGIAIAELTVEQDVPSTD